MVMESLTEGFTSLKYAIEQNHKEIMAVLARLVESQMGESGTLVPRNAVNEAEGLWETTQTQPQETIHEQPYQFVASQEEESEKTIKGITMNEWQSGGATAENDDGGRNFSYGPSSGEIQMLKHPPNIGPSHAIHLDSSLLKSNNLEHILWMLQVEKNIGEPKLEEDFILPSPTFIYTCSSILFNDEIQIVTENQLKWEKELDYVIWNVEDTREKGQFVLPGSDEQISGKCLVNWRGNTVFLWTGASGYGVMMYSILGSFLDWLCLDDLEFTPKYAIFTLLDIPLCHGKNCDVEVQYEFQILGFYFHNWRPPEGNYSLCNQLVVRINLKEPLDPKDVAYLVGCLEAVTGKVTCISTNHHQTLHVATIEMSLWNHGVDVMNALVEMIIPLALSRDQYVNLCLEMLVNKLMPLHISSTYLIELLETIWELYKKQQALDRVHSPSTNIANLVRLVPLGLEKDQAGYKFLQQVFGVSKREQGVSILPKISMSFGDTLKIVVSSFLVLYQNMLLSLEHISMICGRATRHGVLMVKTGRTWWPRLLQIGSYLLKNAGLLWLTFTDYGVLHGTAKGRCFMGYGSIPTVRTLGTRVF